MTCMNGAYILGIFSRKNTLAAHRHLATLALAQAKLVPRNVRERDLPHIRVRGNGVDGNEDVEEDFGAGEDARGRTYRSTGWG